LLKISWTFISSVLIGQKHFKYLLDFFSQAPLTICCFALMQMQVLQSQCLQFLYWILLYFSNFLKQRSHLLSWLCSWGWTFFTGFCMYHLLQPFSYCTSHKQIWSTHSKIVLLRCSSSKTCPPWRCNRE
jgi:hypothetical protein